jgi:hypothetical protein
VPRAPERKASLLYRPWFVLMIAGALGGLAGWGVVEPFLDDGVSFEGRVDQRLPAPPGTVVLDVSGVHVGVVPGRARLTRDGAVVTLEEIPDGAHVRVVAFTPRKNLQIPYWASELQVLPGEAPAGQLSMAAVHVRDMLLGLLVFPIIAALVSLFVAAADGVLSHAWRRAALCAVVGLACGLALGLVTSAVGEVAYHWTEKAVFAITDDMGSSVLGFLAQMVSRGLSWAITGVAMGLGQGIALRSKRMVVNGLLGGMVGGLLGGMLFDPIDKLWHLHADLYAGAELSRAAGFMVIGLTTGLMIGVVELLARDAWLKMLIGPLAGKEFVLFKNPTVLGSSPKADIYLFKDPDVEPIHALLHALGDGYELEDRAGAGRTLVNGRPVRRARLESGDQVRIGRTVLSFGLKET